MRRPWALPLGPLYAAGSWLRWAGVRPKRLAWPVVSVGSLSAGGAGKTPFVIALVGLLKERGVAVDVLSRGYSRVAQGPAWVKADGDADLYGDEPLLIAQEAAVMVYVAEKRIEAGLLAEGLESQITVHLLDDGFQHRQLFRDVDVVLVSSADLKDWLLPAGNRREPLSALRRADVLAVAVGDDAAVERLCRIGLTQPVWRFRREMTMPEVDGPVVAFCGIARPEQFLAGLEQAGVSIVERRTFGDHHRFTDGDLAGLREMVTRSGAVALVTTAKDRVRLGSRAEELRVPVLVAGLRVEFEDQTEVARWLSDAIGSIPPRKGRTGERRKVIRFS